MRTFFHVSICVMGLACSALPVAFADQPPVAAGAATTPAHKAAPEIHLAQDGYDFSKVMSGDLVKHEFVFTNTGDAMLVISNVMPACHCTTAGAWTREVPPGKTGVIPLQLDSSIFSGPVTRAVTVYCNDPKRPVFTLRMSGSVWKPVEFTPANGIFSLISDSDVAQPVVIQITNHLEEPITLSEPQSPNHMFSAELKTIQPGKEFQLTIKAMAPFGPASVSGVISMRTSSTRVPVLSVPVYAVVNPAVIVVPNQLRLLPGPLAMATTNVITVLNRSARHSSLTLSNLTASAKGVDVHVKETQPGRQFAITVVFPAGYVNPSTGGEVTMQTSHPDFAEIKIPVVQPAPPMMITAPRQVPTPGQPAPVRPARPGVDVKGQ